MLGGASTVGGVKLGYQYGISGLWLVFMLGLGILVLRPVLVERILGSSSTPFPSCWSGLRPVGPHRGRRGDGRPTI